tara:strand:- start:286 stop:411 length:126 start_codon:yes stop_codon:yes gene_type:complete
MQKTEIINGLEAMVDTLDGFGAEDLDYYLGVIEAVKNLLEE